VLGRACWALLVIGIGLLALTSRLVAEEGGPAPPDWVSALHRDHPLVGTVWSVRDERAVSPDELVERLKPAALVLLGEVHDNPDHHRLRAWLIGRLAREESAGRENGPAVVFEHIRADQQPIVDAFRASPDRGVSSILLDKLEWSRSGWPPAEMFRPLFDEVLGHDLPVLGGNAPSNQVRQVAQKGLSALSDVERTRLAVDQQLDTPLRDALIEEIEENHCGLLPERAFAPMALAQQYRDAHLADVLLQAQRQHGTAVLIAGNGHVRADRGVPWHLIRRAPGLATSVVSFVEVEAGQEEAARYLPRDPNGQPAVDYVWFTPKAEREDPCERMRRGMKGEKGASPKQPSGVSVGARADARGPHEELGRLLGRRSLDLCLGAA